MKLAPRVLSGLVLLAAASALVPPLVLVQAASDDLTYCTTLYDMAVKYRGRAIQGESKPDLDMVVALEQCKHGNAAAGIATLEHKLRDGRISIPPR